MKIIATALIAFTILACAPARPEPPTPGPTPTKAVTYTQRQLDNAIIEAAQATIEAIPTPTARIVERKIVVTATPTPTITPTPVPTPTVAPTPSQEELIAEGVKATIEAMYPPTLTPPPAALTPLPSPTPMNNPAPTPFYADLRAMGLSDGMVAYIKAKTGNRCALPDTSSLKTVWSKVDGVSSHAYSVMLPDAPAFLVFRATASNGAAWDAQLTAKSAFGDFSYSATATELGAAKIIPLCAAEANAGAVSLIVEASNAGWELYALGNGSGNPAPVWAINAAKGYGGGCGNIGLPPYQLSASKSSAGRGGGTQYWNVSVVKPWTLVLYEFDPEKPSISPGKATLQLSGQPTVIVTGNNPYGLVAVCGGSDRDLTLQWQREWGDFTMWTLSPK